MTVFLSFWTGKFKLKFSSVPCYLFMNYNVLNHVHLLNVYTLILMFLSRTSESNSSIFNLK